MFKDVFLSFKDNFKEKTTNPFLGLYISMLFIRNWELVYSLFNFHETMSLEKKLEYIHHYFVNGNGYIGELLLNIGWALVVLVVTYTLINISRFIVNIFEKQLTPLIYKITDSKSIVMKSTYETLRAERDSILERLESEREQKSKLEILIKKYEDRIIELKSENKTSQKDIEYIGEVSKDVYSGKVDSGETLNLKRRLELDKQKDKFLEFALMLKSGDGLMRESENYDDIMYFLKLGLLTIDSNRTSSYKYFVLTDKGDELFNELRFE